MMFTPRALHYVFRIGDRAKNAHFFRNVLGMKVLRHEEFTKGCDAQCNGPYDNRWSKTMVGYGPESKHFVIELAYNYGIKSYELGNDCDGITIRSKGIIDKARKENYPIEDVVNGSYKLISPDGYKFFIIDEPAKNENVVEKVTINCANLKDSIFYWHDILNMKVVSEEEKKALLSYDSNQTCLELYQIDVPINRAKTAGRIAFAIPKIQQELVDKKIKQHDQTILTPLITIDTPGKASVRVIILADPNEHEICFVDEEGFSELSLMDPSGNNLLDKYIGKDPFQ